MKDLTPLKELIEFINNKSGWTKNNIILKEIDDKIDELLAREHEREQTLAQVAGDAWIDVKNREFDYDKSYLLFGTGWSVPIVGSFWDTPGDIGWHSIDGELLWNVTYYMPLPESPKKNTYHL